MPSQRLRFSSGLHGEPGRSLPLEEAAGFSRWAAEFCWKHLGIVFITRSVCAAPPRAKNMAERRGVSPARKEPRCERDVFLFPFEAASPNRARRPCRDAPAPPGCREVAKPERRSPPGRIFPTENKFCPQIPPGRCLPVISVPSILAFNLPAPQAASAEEESCGCRLAFRNARRLRREGSRLPSTPRE